MKKVTKFFMAALLAGICSLGYGQSAGGHEYVDLGLSVKWATCNIGASSPTELGSLFKWGETVYSASSRWDTYKYAETEKNGRAKKMLKYRTVGWGADNKTQLELSDDAAAVNWGVEWRMPTKEEAEELIRNCNWQMLYHFGTICVKATSKRNGRCIYFPVPSHEPNAYIGAAAVEASFWTSTLDPSSEKSVCAFILNVYDTDNPKVRSSARRDRYQVRPVRR